MILKDIKDTILVKNQLGYDIDSTKSFSDKKKYRYLTLDNGLEVILISDENSPPSLSTASLTSQPLLFNFGKTWEI